MRIGLSYDLKTSVAPSTGVEDALEEYDSPETIALIAAAIESEGHEVASPTSGRSFWNPL